MLKAAKGGVKVVFLLSSYIYIVESVRKKIDSPYHSSDSSGIPERSLEIGFGQFLPFLPNIFTFFDDFSKLV